MGSSQATELWDTEQSFLKSFDIWVEIERFILSQQDAEMQSARIHSSWGDMQKYLRVGVKIAEEVYPTGDGSGETTLLLTAHTARKHIAVYSEKCLSGERSFIISIRSSSCNSPKNPCARKTRRIQSRRRTAFSHISEEEPCTQQSQEHSQLLQY